MQRTLLLLAIGLTSCPSEDTPGDGATGDVAHICTVGYGCIDAAGEVVDALGAVESSRCGAPGTTEEIRADTERLCDDTTRLAAHCPADATLSCVVDDCSETSSGCDEDSLPSNVFICGDLTHVCADSAGVFSSTVEGPLQVEGATLSDAQDALCGGVPCFDGDTANGCCFEGATLLDCFVNCTNR